MSRKKKKRVLFAGPEGRGMGKGGSPGGQGGMDARGWVEENRRGVAVVVLAMAGCGCSWEPWFWLPPVLKWGPYRR